MRKTSRKKIFCLGDSLTEGDYGIAGKSGIGNVRAENYPHFLAELSGCEVENLGRCGSTSTSYFRLLTNGEINVKGADVIIIMLGTNGRMEKKVECRDFTDYLELIAFCKKNAKSAKLVLCTPPHATEDPSYSNCGYMPNIRCAVETVRYAAELLSLPLIDIFENPEICKENVHKYQSADGLHFNEAGYRLLAQIIYDGLKENYIL